MKKRQLFIQRTHQLELFGPKPARQQPGRFGTASPARKPPKPLQWEGMGSWVRHIGRLLAVESASSDHYARFRDTARQLTVERVRSCRHIDDLERVEKLLAVDARYSQGWLFGLDRVWPKHERGALLVEVRNRMTLLRIGREVPKPKGPRYDLARLPIDVIDRLIQRHPDIALVERLRVERNRRTAKC